MTTVQTCKRCAKLFSFLPRGICSGCIDHCESQFQLVREWLIDNQGRTIAAVTEGSGVDQKLIVEFVREGRLELITEGPTSDEENRSRNALRARIANEMAKSDDAPRATGATTATPATPVAPTRHSGMRTRS